MKCKYCNQEKTADDFYKHNKSRCKICERIRKNENRNKNRKIYGRLPSDITKSKNENMTLESFCRKRLNAAKIRASKKGIPFDLDVDWYIENMEKGCSVTGVKLDRKGTKSVNTPSIDQIIPSKGYTKENCRIVSYWYNTAKNAFSDEQVLEMCKLVISNSEGR